MLSVVSGLLVNKKTNVNFHTFLMSNEVLFNLILTRTAAKNNTGHNSSNSIDSSHSNSRNNSNDDAAVDGGGTDTQTQTNTYTDRQT